MQVNCWHNCYINIMHTKVLMCYYRPIHCTLYIFADIFNDLMCLYEIVIWLENGTALLVKKHLNLYLLVLTWKTCILWILSIRLFDEQLRKHTLKTDMINDNSVDHNAGKTWLTGWLVCPFCIAVVLKTKSRGLVLHSHLCVVKCLAGVIRWWWKPAVSANSIQYQVTTVLHSQWMCCIVLITDVIRRCSWDGLPFVAKRFTRSDKVVKKHKKIWKKIKKSKVLPKKRKASGRPSLLVKPVGRMYGRIHVYIYSIRMRFTQWCGPNSSIEISISLLCKTQCSFSFHVGNATWSTSDIHSIAWWHIVTVLVVVEQNQKCSLA